MSGPSATERPRSIEVRNVEKTFRITPGPVPLRKRIRKPSSGRARMLEVLRDISFDVYQGEFFGIVGRNGSGKSTLLKLLASVYAADAGRIRIAGRLAPFLELGVGFNPQVAARENVVLNGVMMGLTPAEANRRCDAIIDFAGLREFTDLQLKNYSSGMKVRLAFAALTQVDADVLLLDEVLAVGDAEFQAKCDGVFRRMHDEGRTIVLVTHSMTTVNAQCDRAMLIHDGEIAALGNPLEITNRYLELNMRAAAETHTDHMAEYATRFADVMADPPIRIVDAWMAGERAESGHVVAEREPIEVRVIAEVLRGVDRPGFQFRIDDDQGQVMFRGGSEHLGAGDERALPGERLEVVVTIENRLAAGNYVFTGGMAQLTADGSAEPATPFSLLKFEVTGDQRDSVLSLEHEVTLDRASANAPRPPR